MSSKVFAKHIDISSWLSESVARKKHTFTPANPYAVYDLLNSGYGFIIPRFQRAYSWDCVKNIDDFWNDLNTAIFHGDTHPFGSIEANSTTVEREWQKDGKSWAKYPFFTISDGQQRLTTFILFYAAYAHYCKSGGNRHVKNPDVLKELQRIFFRVDRSGQTIQLLQLQEPGLQDCLDLLVEKGEFLPNNPSAVRKMKNAYQEFFKRFSDVTNDSQSDDIFKALMSYSEVIFITSNSNEHMKFEVRNNRGNSPNDLDRVKNLIQLIEERGYIKGGLKFPMRWYESIKLLDQNGLGGKEDQLLKHTMSVTFGRNFEGKMYSHFKSKFWSLSERGNTNLEEKLTDFCKAFDDMSRAMCGVFAIKPTSPFGNHLKFAPPRSGNEPDLLLWQKNLGRAHGLLADLSLRLDREGVFSTFILACYSNLKENEVRKYLKILSNLEKTTFRVYQISTGRRETRTDLNKHEHARKSMEIYHGFEVNRKLKFLKKKGLKVMIPDITNWAIKYLCDFTVNDNSRTLSSLYETIREGENAYRLTWARYFLYHWELQRSPSLTLSYTATKEWFSNDNSNYEKEHIMPQNPREETSSGKNLEKYWFRKTEGPIFEHPDNFAKWIDRLGNLVMTMKVPNRDYYSNHPYIIHSLDPFTTLIGSKRGEKRSLYLDKTISNYGQVKEVGKNYQRWDQEVIMDRQERMARWAIKRWQMDCDCDKPPKLQPLRFIDGHSPEFRTRNSHLSKKSLTEAQLQPAMDVSKGKDSIEELKQFLGVDKHPWDEVKSEIHNEKDIEIVLERNIDPYERPEVPVADIIQEYTFDEDFYTEELESEESKYDKEK